MVSDNIFNCILGDLGCQVFDLNGIYLGGVSALLGQFFELNPAIRIHFCLVNLIKSLWFNLTFSDSILIKFLLFEFTVVPV